ncbi:DUF2637 domain-containing protein [Nonomuraea sp. NPDC050540]
MRRLATWLLDTGPIIVLAAIAGAGSFTHIRDTATEHGQPGWMSWAVAICVDLTCVMAARERQRDKHHHRVRRGPASWPTLVLSLAANLRSHPQRPARRSTSSTTACRPRSCTTQLYKIEKGPQG